MKPDTERLRQWASEIGVTLDADMCGQFARYAEILLDWNTRMNLTAITDPAQIMRKHFLDSLLLIPATGLTQSQSALLLDVGTGAGMPGIPLKIALPKLELSLLDSLGKRVAFLREISDILGQQNTVLHGRAEELSHRAELREVYDIVTARAVSALPVLSELCLPFVRIGGIFAAMKGPDCTQEVQASKNAINLLGGELSHVKTFELPQSEGRSLVIIKKISQTPPKYPRTGKKLTRKPL